MKILRSQYMKLRDRPTATTTKNITDFENESFDDNDNDNVYNETHVMSLNRHSQTINCNKTLTASTAMGSNIQIHFDHIDESLDNLKVIVEFTDMNASWLTQLFKSYENDLWHRTKRFSIEKKNKNITYWFYHCDLCQNVYTQLPTIKGHLNKHLKFFPYVCKVCGLKYTTRKSATSHLKNCHKLHKDLWNEHLTS